MTIPVFEKLDCRLFEVNGPVSTNRPSTVVSIIHLLTLFVIGFSYDDCVYFVLQGERELLIPF